MGNLMVLGDEQMIKNYWVVVSFFLLLPLFGEDSHFDLYFSKGMKPPIFKKNNQLTTS